MNRAYPIPDCPAWVRKAMDAKLAGTLEEAEQARMAAYLEAHPKVARYLTQEQALLDLAIQPRRPDLHEAYWAAQADRIEAQIGERTQPDASALPETLRMRRTATDMAWGHWIPKPVLQGVIAVLLVAFGVLLGRTYFGSEAPPVSDPSDPYGSHFQPASMESRAHQYLGRSKVLLLGLVNADPNAPEALRMDRKKTVANDLLQESGFLIENLNNPEQQQLRQLVSDLERILLQIANLESQQDIPAIEMVQSGIERQGIFLKINLEEMRMMGASSDAPSLGQL